MDDGLVKFFLSFIYYALLLECVQYVFRIQHM